MVIMILTSCLKVWYLYYKWAGIWKTLRMEMRIGNFNIQKKTPSNYLPIFANILTKQTFSF